VIDVANRPDIAMRLVPLEFRFAHGSVFPDFLRRRLSEPAL
jgi:hypothetical protein